MQRVRARAPRQPASPRGRKPSRRRSPTPGFEREDVDGLSIHLGWPLGIDYDRVAEAFGLDIRYVNQSWLHGRFVTNALQHAALAVSAGLADVVACVTAVSFTRERGFLGGPGDHEGNREEGGTHGEAPPYGLTAPAGGAAIAMQRYMHLYGATSAGPCRRPDRDPPARAEQSARDSARAAHARDASARPHGGRSAAALRLLPDQRRRRGRAGDAPRPRARLPAEAGADRRDAGTARGARGIHLRAARARHQPAVGRSDRCRRAISKCSRKASRATPCRVSTLTMRSPRWCCSRSSASAIAASARLRRSCRTAASRPAARCR